ncbi:hypothetical protein PG993_004126 [Apiospora rasikravindrae]|uniref:Protein kinase domain-containing protein n=1 Tax=Apiospora rasikravindrae TaxID=990691 RepID=A0ABR1TBV4_9PEZI
MSASPSNKQAGVSNDHPPLIQKRLTTADLISLYPCNPPKRGVLEIGLIEIQNLHLPDEIIGALSVDSSTDIPKTDRWRPLAVLEYDGFQVPAPAFMWTNQNGMAWTETWKLDITASSDLTIHFLAFGSNDLSQLPRCLSLARLTIDPFLETWQSFDVANIDLPDNTGNLSIHISFWEKQVGPSKMPQMQGNFKNIQLNDLIQVENVGVKNGIYPLKRYYGMTTVHAAEFNGESRIAPLRHPFIAPLKYAFESPAGLSLLSHLGSGGHLFGHLQEERRFEIEKARFYAAELVCVLEFLHGQNIINCLKPENTTVDPFGHISICAPGLFALEIRPENMRSTPGDPEFPAPELVRGGVISKIADWWTLGVFLYEMLTGLSPFYSHKDEARKLNITSQDVQLATDMQPEAVDLLTRLLDKNPAKRLGANGASEIKSHVFFGGVNWHQLQQKNPTPFIPKIARVRDGNEDDATKQPPVIPEANGWEFAWDSPACELRFKNAVTNQEFLIKSPDQEAWQLAPTPTTDEAQIDSDRDKPSTLFWREALRTALKNNYGRQLISMILRQGVVDINQPILLYEEPAETKYLPLEPEIVPLTPLEWAVEHDRIDLFHLFLEAGANANRTFQAAKGPALLKAVRRDNLYMVQVLAPLTGRVSCTRALGLAVGRQSAAVVEALLQARSPSTEGGQQQQHVRCDFEAADAPLRDRSYVGWTPDNDQYVGGGPAPAPHDFAPPLARRARLGNAALVRVLLAHGADPNAGYHDGAGVAVPYGWYDEGEKPAGRPPSPQIRCGRPVQLAMELHGHGEVVDLLLDAGADVALAQPVWPVPVGMERAVPVHTCALAPRSVYLRVTAALEDAVARRKEVKQPTAVASNPSSLLQPCITPHPEGHHLGVENGGARVVAQEPGTGADFALPTAARHEEARYLGQECGGLLLGAVDVDVVGGFSCVCLEGLAIFRANVIAG